MKSIFKPCNVEFDSENVGKSNEDKSQNGLKPWKEDNTASLLMENEQNFAQGRPFGKKKNR